MVVETEDSKKYLEHPLKIKGEVFSGFGEGGYYISLEAYKKQFKEKLNLDPYLGTLNIKLSSLSDLRKKNILENSAFPKIKISGFKEGKRTFGDVDAIKVKINNKIDGAILFIQRTHHSSPILEIISKEYLREKLDLKDGDEIELEILYES